ncbi:hypothetical protein COO60DRAFT_1266883, partial [Scenedesmus sp. NREL 46B-D3]
KYTYLGLYDTEIEAAMAYDRAAVKLKGLAAITNFDLSMYLDELNPGGALGFGLGFGFRVVAVCGMDWWGSRFRVPTSTIGLDILHLIELNKES